MTATLYVYYRLDDGFFLLDSVIENEPVCFESSEKHLEQSRLNQWPELMLIYAKDLETAWDMLDLVYSDWVRKNIKHNMQSRLRQNIGSRLNKLM